MDKILGRFLIGTVLCGIVIINQAGFAGEDLVAVAGSPMRTLSARTEDAQQPYLDTASSMVMPNGTAFVGPPVRSIHPLKKLPSWGQLDFLLMWRKPQNLPPLVTTSPSGTPLAQAGQLNQATTTTILGGRSLMNGPSTGGRIDFGYWLDAHPQMGLGGSFLALGNSTLAYATDSATTPIVTRPFLNVTDGQTAAMDALIVSFPDEAAGDIEIQGTSKLIVAEGYLRQIWHNDPSTPIDLVAGYQFSRIDENLMINSHSTALSTSQLRPPGTTLALLDSISTQNEFHGGQIGVLNDWDNDCMKISASFKLGLGNMRQRAVFLGHTVIDDSVNSVTDAQGLLTRNTNIGIHERNVITVIPQINLRGTYSVTHRVDVTIGYSLIFFPHVIQPAEQLDPDLAVNFANPVLGESRPEFTFQSRDYWVQGLTFGLRWNY